MKVNQETFLPLDILYSLIPKARLRTHKHAPTFIHSVTYFERDLLTLNLA